MRKPAARMGSEERRCVLSVIRESCRHNQWFLHAAHVRSNHVHVVVSARTEPERVMKKLKARATLGLNDQFGKKDPRWARHGSTAYIWRAEQVDSAVDYVVRRQGKPLSVYENKNRWQDFSYW